jgi:branched-chain amino acid transport system permease protein
MTTLVLGLVLGGTYALLALGLTLQYGIARIMNLAYGEVTLLAAFGLVFLFQTAGLPPLVAIVLIGPAGYLTGWLLYSVMMRPLVRRAAGKPGKLEVDSILATFGLLFVLQGIMLVLFGANFTSISYLDQGVNVLGVSVAANRLIAFVICLVAGRPDVRAAPAPAGADPARRRADPGVGAAGRHRCQQGQPPGLCLGGRWLPSAAPASAMYQTFSANDGVVFTMKALIIVIMGGSAM